MIIRRQKMFAKTKSTIEELEKTAETVTKIIKKNKHQSGNIKKKFPKSSKGKC